MRITFVLTGAARTPGGSHRVVYNYANHLSALGHDVNLVFPHHIRWLDRQPSGVVRRVKRHLRRFRQRLSNPRPKWMPLHSRVATHSVSEPTGEHIPDGDVVIATHWALIEYVRQYDDRKGTKAFLIHHHDSHSGAPPAEVDEAWQLPYLKFAVSKHTVDAAKERGIDDIEYIRNGVDLETYTLVRPIEARGRVVAAAYVPRKIKDPKGLIHAVSQARCEFPDLKAVFYGAAARDPAIPPWIKYYRAPSDGFVARSILNTASVFVCSSLLEGFGLPGAEALSCGCALVTTDCGGVREYAEHGVTALLSPPGHHDMLAENLQRVLGDDAFRTMLAHQGHDRVQSFSWHEAAVRLEGLLSSHTHSVRKP